MSPQRRRIEDTGLPPTELILYQLSELKSQFSRLEGDLKTQGARFEGLLRESVQEIKTMMRPLEERVGSLERFRDRLEERDRVEAQASQKVRAWWVPWSIAAATLIVTVALAFIQTQ